MNRTIIRRVRLTPDESSALDSLLVGTTFSKWVRESINVATNKSVATKKAKIVATNTPTNHTKKDIHDLIVAGSEAKKASEAEILATHQTSVTMKYGLSPPIDIKSTEKVSIEQAGEKQLIKTCASCSNKIKKGFLCDDCLK